jgi:hypothetical protein
MLVIVQRLLEHDGPALPQRLLYNLVVEKNRLTVKVLTVEKVLARTVPSVVLPHAPGGDGKLG